MDRVDDKRKPYSKPCLTRLGLLRKLTRLSDGGSGGGGGGGGGGGPGIESESPPSGIQKLSDN